MNESNREARGFLLTGLSQWELGSTLCFYALYTQKIIKRNVVSFLASRFSILL